VSEPTFQTIPILRIFDVEKAKDFYVGFLGLRVDWEHRFDTNAPVYMQVSRQSLILHLTEHHGDCCPGSTVFVRITNLDQFHQELMVKGYAYMRPRIKIAPWNAKVMEIIDPFGNRLRFNEDLTSQTSRI
jgi:catechol 2,3-dioxygenase-like lactoylglutathione lyase family enzyme